MIDIYYNKQRVINFSDAVFSIAMTLLVLEITVPSFKALNEKGTINLLSELIPNFIGLVVSFFVIALYWIAHMRIMSYVKAFDVRLLWLNLFLLFFIILLPFSTALYVRGSGLNGPFVFYCLNITMLGVVIYFLVRKVFSMLKTENQTLKIISKWEEVKALNSVFIWLLAVALSFIAPRLSKIIFILIFVFEIIINKYYRNKINSLAEK